MSTTMRLIAKNVLGSDTSSVTFSDIPGTYTDLFLAISGRTDNTGGNGDDVKTTFNGSTSGYSNRRLYGSGIVTGSDSNFGGTAAMRLGAVCDNGSTSNTFGAFEMYVPNYAGSTNKSISAVGAQEDNEATAYMIISAGLWSNTAAITSIGLAPGAGSNWKSGSSFFLYGITKA